MARASAQVHLERLVIAAGSWLVAYSAEAALISGVGWWTPWVGIPLAVLTALGVHALVRRVPTSDGDESSSGRAAVPLVLVALAFAVWAGATHAEQVLPRRDSASNLQAAISLAETHGRIVPVDVDRFGGAEVLAIDGVTLASPAFYAVGDAAHPEIQPQFVIGPAAVYGLGVWLGGPPAAMWFPAIAGALGLLAIGLISARILGAWWGVAAAGLSGLTFPILHVSRSTYSEPLALVTLGAGLLALVLAAYSSPGPRDATDARTARRCGLLAGLLVGGTIFVRIDGLREVILLLVVAGLAAAQRRPWVGPLLLGVGASTAVSMLAALWLSDQYLGSIGGSLLPLLALGLVVGVLVLVALAAWRRGLRWPPAYARSLPASLAAMTLLVLVFLASRPLWLVTRQDPDDPGARYVAGMQARQGLPVDGGRTYAEQTIVWLHWWVGPLTLVAALLVLVTIVEHAAKDWVAEKVLQPWVWPLVVVAGSTLMTLWRPGITPDHPWAERRLVVAVPFLVVLAVALVARIHTEGFRRRAAGEPFPSALRTPLGVLDNRWLLVVVAIQVLFGTVPLATARAERGSLAAVGRVCEVLGPQDVALMVDSRAAQEWVQVVRGQCGTPSLALTSAARKDPDAYDEAVEQVRRGVTAAGGTLVLMAADESLPTGAGDWRTVVDVTVEEDQHLLERRPDDLDPLRIVVRMTPG